MRQRLGRIFPFIAILFIFVVLIFPNRLSLMAPSAFISLPIEGLVLGFILLIPNKLGSVLRYLVALCLTLDIVLKVADIGTYQFFDRGFNPVVDSHFWIDGLNFLQGAVGELGSLLIIVTLLGLVMGLILFVAILLKTIQITLQKAFKASILSLSIGVTLWFILLLTGSSMATKPFYQLINQHIHQTVTGLEDLATFNQELSLDPYATVPEDKLFSKLKGKDVLVVFIESYGRTVLDKKSYADHVRPVLEQANNQLTQKGFMTRSAYITSPTYGGISWLAHGTLMSGLWVNNQTRYDRLVASNRSSLNRLFKRAGWRTLAVQPAHTMAWPQGEYFGYDQIYAAQDLGYKGKPFNWITMPDQYTLSAFHARELTDRPRNPVMAEIALISSHAPWTPLPHLIDWNQVADGQVFIEQATAGESAETVWKDTERIREHYRKSIEYALSNLASFISTYGNNNWVVLMLGDHQPVPFVTEESDRREVIAHIITKDTKLLEAIKDWQWTEGMIPADHTPIIGMDKLRDQFISSYSTFSPQQ